MTDKHIDGPSYYCPTCQKHYKTRNSFEVHVHNYHKNWRGFDLNKFTQTWIKKLPYPIIHLFFFPFSVVDLIAIRSVDDLLKYCTVAGTQGSTLCTICGKTLKNIKRHMLDMHFGDSTYYCPPCQRRYKTRNSFESHVTMKHREWRGSDLSKFAEKWNRTLLSFFAVVDKNIKRAWRICWNTGDQKDTLCLICDNTKTTKNIERHMLDKHFIPTYYCPYFNRKYSSKSSFANHIKNVLSKYAENRSEQ